MQDFYTYQFEDLLIHQTPCLWSTFQSYNYMIARDGKAYIFDPGEFEPIENTLKKNNLKLEAIYLTHHHGDHVGAVKEFSSKYQCEVIGFQKDQKRLPPLTKTYFENEKLQIAGHEAEILFLPGHTLGLCAFYFKELNLLFSNDHIFSLGCGRVFEGTMEQMFESLQQVRELPDETVIFPSHEYTLSNLNFALKLFPNDPLLISVTPVIEGKVSSQIPTVPVELGFEKKYNPFLRWDDPEIRKTMELEEAQDWEVFAEIRHLKDIS